MSIPLDLRKPSETRSFFKDYVFSYKNAQGEVYKSCKTLSEVLHLQPRIVWDGGELWLRKEDWCDVERNFFWLCAEYELWDHIYDDHRHVSYWIHEKLYASLCNGTFKELTKREEYGSKVRYFLSADFSYEKPLYKIRAKGWF